MIERDSDCSSVEGLKVSALEDDTLVVFYDSVFDLEIEVDSGFIKRAQEVLEKHQKEIILTMIAGGSIMAVIELSQLVRRKAS